LGSMETSIGTDGGVIQCVCSHPRGRMSVRRNTPQSEESQELELPKC
jgi:exosome complex RNA-binding protein Csl4